MFSCITGYYLQGSTNSTCQFGEWNIGIEPTCEPSPCANPSLNDTRVEISLNVTEYQHNETVMFSCISGYYLQGSTNSTCQFGEWNIGIEPTCEPLPCAMPSTDDEMVEISPNKSEYLHNETVTFSCPDGYELIGDETELCQFGVWDGRLEPSCHIENISCERLSLEDGLVTLDPDYSKYPNGTTVYFECPEGYSLVGNSSATCRTASWDLYKEPECFASPCANPSLNDTRVEVSPNSTEHQHNDTVTFSCLYGYDLQGSFNATCQFGEWSMGVEPSCKPSPCANPRLNDTRVEISPNDTEHQHSETVTFSCLPGYVLQGSANATCQIGEWDMGVEPSCEPSPCVNPSLNDTRVEISPNGTEHQHSETVTFSCLPGYELQGSANATCQFGEWTMGLEPSCEPSPCANPSLNDTRVEVSPNSTEHQHSETVTFSCLTGYVLQGSANATCQFGEWDINVEPSCEPSPCINPTFNDTRVELSPNGTKHQHSETVTFSCLPGYELQGSANATCQFGEWAMGLEPSCEPSPCANPSLKDTRVEVSPNSTEHQHSETVTFSCLTGYVLQGSANATCQFGEWDMGVEPSCEPSPCAYPSLNDTRVEVSPNSTEHQHSEIVTFSCLSGYDLQGSANATCQFGEWDMGVEPTCKPSPCTKPSLNDTRVEVSPGITEYQHNETVAFSCISGYDLQGSANATCQFGKWDMGVEPTCEPLACDMPSVDDDMVEISPNKSEYQHNETVKFSCPNGYKLIGDETETCQFGVWDGRLEPSCHIEIKECANPYPEDYNVIIEPYEYRYENGSTVLYSCPEGFTLFGISSATCMFGRWVPSADPPSCEAKGCERPQVEGVNFEPARESYDDGDKIIFFCSDSGTLVGSDSSTCTRGEFSPSSFPTCADTTSEFCNSSSLENKDEISYTPEYETYNKGEEVYLSCKNSSLALVPFIGKMQCQRNNGWSPQFPDCGECRNSEMCQTNSQRVCDKETRLCLCPPGFEPFEGICIETTAVVTEVYLDAHFNKTLEDNSSDEFLNLQKQVCFAFEITLTNRSSNVKDGYVSCYVESFSNGSIITDVVTKYNKEENVTPQQVTDIIATEAEQQEHYTIPYLTLNFTLDSEIKSNEKIINVDACGETDVCDPVNAECHYHGGSVYSCMCRTGFIDTFPDVPGVSCVPKVRDPPLALTVGLGVGVALCFVVILVTSVAIFGRYTNNDDSKTISSQDSNDDDDVNDLVPSHSPKVDLSMHNSFDTSFVNHRYNSDEYMSGSLDPVSETARMSAIAKIIQNMGNMKPMPRIQPPRGSNHNQIMSNL